MATESVVEARHLASRQGDVSRRLRHVALAVPAISLPGGVVAMALGLRFGLFAAALILGWTQLVGP